MGISIRVVFAGLEKDKPSWPYINYDVEKRAQEVMATLRKSIENVEFSHVVYYSRQEAEKGYEENEKDKYDGWLFCITSIGSWASMFYTENVRPLVVADEMYCGAGEFLAVRSRIESEDLPVTTVSSSNFEDVVDAVRLLVVMARLRRSKILVFSDREKPFLMGQDKIDAVRDLFGTEVVYRSGEDLRQAYKTISAADAGPVRAQWIEQARSVVEPDADELLRSARMYLAAKQLIDSEKADAISIDCLSLFYSSSMTAYPCLTFFQLNNEGQTGVCEGDLHSTIAQLMFRYLCKRPAYVSDPVIDEATGQIIYAHCVATNRPYGPVTAACPYIIRSHAEDLKGASVQSLLPLGQTVTTIAISAIDRMMGLHTARTVANIDDNRGCRTKLAAEVNTEKLLQHYNGEIFGWHQVTCYGDYRLAMKKLARLYGMKCIEQDR